MIWRPERAAAEYEFLDAGDVESLEDEFRRHGRSAMLADGGLPSSRRDRFRNAGPGVRLMGADDVEDVAASLAAAFDDDPVWEYLVRGSRNRTGRLSTIFRTMIRQQHLPHSASYTDSRGPEARFGIPRSLEDDSVPAASLLSGFHPGIRHEHRQLGTNAVHRSSTRHPKAPPHYYLAVLGTVPTGRAKGSALRCSGRSSTDATRKGSGLTSSPRRNPTSLSMLAMVSQSTGEIRLPKGPRLWPMWRDPQPHSQKADP